MKNAIDSLATAFEGDAIEYRGEDGIYVSYRPQVGVTVGGIDYILPNAHHTVWTEDGSCGLVWVYDFYQATGMAERINATGLVDLDGWVAVEPYDLETELDNEFEREQFERAW